VERHAADRDANGGRTWGEWREDFRDSVSGETTDIAKRVKAQAAITVSMRHAEMLAKAEAAASELVESALRSCEPRDVVKLWLAIISMQRRIHGLDQARIEVTGVDGKPIEHDLTLDDETRALAKRALELVFGDGARNLQGEQPAPRLRALS
jgi:hypothetical protein